jgi:cytoskeleton protein RodZ
VKCYKAIPEAIVGTFRVGAKLRQERVAGGWTLDEVSRETRISTRFLEAIEADDFDSLPGLVFTRNFVKQFALSMNLDPDPLLAELPKQDESTVQLPDPPAQFRSPYPIGWRLHSALSSGMWVLLTTGAVTGAWFLVRNTKTHSVNAAAPTVVAPIATQAIVPNGTTEPPRMPEPAPAPPVSQHPVQVVITAHQPSWVQLTVDGKTSFTGTLQPDESREFGANAQVKLVAGNAGGLTISLNGKTLDTLGPPGQVRIVKLTAEGPQFLAKAPPPEPDPL